MLKIRLNIILPSIPRPSRFSEHTFVRISLLYHAPLNLQGQSKYFHSIITAQILLTSLAEFLRLAEILVMEVKRRYITHLHPFVSSHKPFIRNNSQNVPRTPDCFSFLNVRWHRIRSGRIMLNERFAERYRRRKSNHLRKCRNLDWTSSSCGQHTSTSVRYRIV